MKTKHAKSIRLGIRYARLSWTLVSSIKYGGAADRVARFQALGKGFLESDQLARSAYEQYAYARGWIGHEDQARN